MKLKDITQLNEASINRLYRHINEANSWAILTSWRDEASPQQNKSNFRKLKQLIRNENLGFIPLEGHGQEEDPETGEIVSVMEPSLFIPNISLDFAEGLRKKFNQFGFVYSGPETNNKVMLVEKGNKQTPLGRFTPNKVAEFYSKVKGKPFVFQ